MDFDRILGLFVVLWAVIDPIGTVPVYLAVAKGHEGAQRQKIAAFSTLVAFGVLLFFLVIGEIILKSMGVSLAAFQISGGIILFLFAIDMIFGSSKPEGELQLVKTSKELAIFPLAIPSIASPGAILAVVLLTDNSRHSIADQIQTAFVMTLVLFINYLFMRFSDKIHKRIGDAGAIIISKVMGLILGAIALNNILIGIKKFFEI